MGCLRKIRRGLIWALLTALVVATLAIVGIQIEERILRWRAGQLLRDIQAIELRQSDWSAAQALMKRWGQFGQYEGSCNEKHCAYQVLLQGIGYKHPNLVYHPFLWQLYLRAGGRPAEVRANWTVDYGRIWGKGFGVFVQVPPRAGQNLGGDDGYTLIGTSQSVSHFGFHYRPQLRLHPGYVIGTPGGCEICLYVYARFTPDADPKDIQRLMRFNLNCLTAWHPCRERDDILPAAWKQYLTELPIWQDNWQAAMKCGNYPLELMGRDSENAAIVDVVSTYNRVVCGEPTPTAAVKLVEKLKGLSAWQPETVRDVSIDKGAVYRGAERGHGELLPGERYVFLLEAWGRGTKAEFQTEPCGAIPATDQNLQALRRGVSLDYFATRKEQRQPDSRLFGGP